MDRYEAVVRYIGTGDYVPRIEKYADGDLVLYAEAASRIAALEAQLAASEARCAELDGAARADEQRLRGAAECAGVGWFGCDTPEVLADTIGALRVDLAAAIARAEEAERVALRSDGRELCWCDVHDEPVIRYGDGSWRCWWQLVVETSDQSQCKVAPLRQAMKEGRGDE